jgi:signal peptidase I
MTFVLHTAFSLVEGHPGLALRPYPVCYISQPVADPEAKPQELKPADAIRVSGATEAVSPDSLNPPASTYTISQKKRLSPQTKKRLFAAVLSAFAPGAGQLILGQRFKGILLLVVFVLVLFCFWPLRAPVSWEALIVVLWVWIGLSWYSVGAALLARGSGDGTKVSRWWVLLVPVLGYIGLNLVWTPLFFAAGFRTEKFLGSSMQPTLFDHDCLMVDEFYYQHQPVKRDDLVEFRRNNSRWMKRVIAVGGDTIEAKDRRVVVNGQVLNEPFVQHIEPLGKDEALDTFGPVTVPPGKYFVMGDNRDFSFDSRFPGFGFVDGAAILGKPLYVYRSRGKGWMMRKDIQ